MQPLTEQTGGVSKGGTLALHVGWKQNSLPFLPCQGPPSFSSLPLPPAPQLHTIDCQVHPGAIGKILFGAVLVQEEHTALVPALVFYPEPLDLERCSCLQPDSSWGEALNQRC
jgi:hypothetical protein